MQEKLRRWEAALMAGVAVALLCGMYLDREQQALADCVIRLHVVANSDAQKDQQLKLLVRDRILKEAEQLYEPEDDPVTACRRLEEHLPRLAELGRRAVEEQGYDYPVSAALESHWFPTKTYDDFALPAGYYTALQIVIGAGEGENWWCVVFPPLCLDSVGQTVEQAAAAGRFSQKQTALITGETQGYVLKFKAVELWQRFAALWNGRTADGG